MLREWLSDLQAMDTTDYSHIWWLVFQSGPSSWIRRRPTLEGTRVRNPAVHLIRWVGFFLSSLTIYSNKFSYIIMQIPSWVFILLYHIKAVPQYFQEYATQLVRSTEPLLTSMHDGLGNDIHIDRLMSYAISINIIWWMSTSLGITKK